MSEDSNDQSVKSSGVARKAILFGILAIGLVALAYDYRVARPAVSDAYDRITERSTKVNADSTKTFTDRDVREIVGREPARTFDDANGDRVEVYSWRAGFPTKTHDLYAVYKPNGDQLLFHRHAKYRYESSSEVSQVSVHSVIDGHENDPTADGDPMDDEAYEASLEAGDTGGDGNEGGRAGGRPRGGGWDPEAMFTENDADGDGVLKDDEIPDRMRERLADIDTDGDGGVSKEELMARFAAMREQRGGRGGGGEGRRGGRPEAESDEGSDDAGSDAAESESGETESAEAAADSSEDADKEEREGGDE